MKSFGLIGNPIDHSLSPKMFKAAYGDSYTYKLIERKTFEDSWARFIEAYDGINVTAPYKELALSRVGICSDECLRIGAANLVLKHLDTTVAYNSDYRGLKLIMERIAVQDSLQLRGMKALVVGCGGAAKAAAVAMLDLGMQLAIVNRTLDKAEEFREHIGYDVATASLESTVEAFEWADLVIYCLPRPIPQIYDIPRLVRHSGKKLIIEANYRKPAFDKSLLRSLEKSGRPCEYVSGRQWLAYQAYTGFGLFTGETPSLEKILSVF